MSDSIIVRVTLGSYDLAHPRERQTQVYVQIPEVARASWLLPANHFGFSTSEPWPSVVDSAHEEYERRGTVSDSASADARAAVMEWLQDDANHDAMHAAWELDEARRHPVARKLLKENEELRARVVELGALPEPQASERECLRAALVAALDRAHWTYPCPALGDRTWSGCVHYDERGRVVGVGSCHSGRRADAVLAVRDVEVDRLRARVAELEAVLTAERSRHTQYEDSPHCQLDGEFWPCRTVAALDAGKQPGEPTAAEVDREAADGDRPAASRPALPWAHAMSDHDLHGFLDDLVSAAMGRWQSDPEVPDRTVLANVEKVCAEWRTPGEGSRLDGSGLDGIVRLVAPTQVLGEVPDGEHYAAVHHEYRTPHDLPETGVQSPDRVVAHRNPASGNLYCRLCCETHDSYTPLTSSDLPDGGVCVCGADVLIDLPETGGERSC